MTNLNIQQEIIEKGLTAPRVTPVDIEANIVREEYFTAFDGLLGNEIATGGTAAVLPTIEPDSKSPFELLTFCVLVLQNGFTVTGESACVSPENFNAEIGRKVARDNAIQKIWPLMGYALKEQLKGKSND